MLTASRIAGRGALVRSLRQLLTRSTRYALHRAATVDERAWCNRLADQLEAALRDATRDPVVVADARRVDQRARVSRKVRP